MKSFTIPLAFGLFIFWFNSFGQRTVYERLNYNEPKSYDVPALNYDKVGDAYQERRRNEQLKQEQEREQIKEFRYKLDNAVKSIETKNYSYAVTLLTDCINNYSSVDSRDIALCYAFRGMAYKLGNFSKTLAINDYDKAGDLDSKLLCPNIYESKGDIYQSQNKFDLAITEYSKSISCTDKVNLDTYWNRANCYYEKGNYEKAREDYTTCLAYADKLDDKKELLFILSLTAGRQNYRNEEIEYLEKYLELDKGNSMVWNNLGYNKFLLGEKAEGLKFVNIALALDSTNAPANDSKCEILFSNNEFKRAKSFCKKALIYDDTMGNSMILLGKIYLTEKNTKESCSYFTKALKTSKSTIAYELIIKHCN